MNNINEELFQTLARSGLTKPGKCYANCAGAVISRYFQYYILGRAKLPTEKFAVRHAWTETNGLFYDPTLQTSNLHRQAKYEPLFRLDRDKIIETIRDHYGPERWKYMQQNAIAYDVPALNHNYEIQVIDS